MTHKLFILLTALVLVGCAGKTRINNTQTTETATVENTIVADSMALAKELLESGYKLADPELLAKLDVARYRQYGLTKIETIDPFVVAANERIVLKDPETVNGGLNDIRFEGWGDKEWLDNNYIRTIRLYIDTYNLGAVVNEELDKYKSSLKGKFALCYAEQFFGGGAWMQIVFIEDTTFTLNFWVYSFLTERNPAVISGYEIRGVEVNDEPFALNAEELKKIMRDDPRQKLW